MNSSIKYWCITHILVLTVPLFFSTNISQNRKIRGKFYRRFNLPSQIIHCQVSCHIKHLKLYAKKTTSVCVCVCICVCVFVCLCILSISVVYFFNYLVLLLNQEVKLNYIIITHIQSFSWGIGVISEYILYCLFIYSQGACEGLV